MHRHGSEPLDPYRTEVIQGCLHAKNLIVLNGAFPRHVDVRLHKGSHLRESQGVALHGRCVVDMSQIALLCGDNQQSVYSVYYTLHDDNVIINSNVMKITKIIALHYALLQTAKAYKNARSLSQRRFDLAKYLGEV